MGEGGVMVNQLSAGFSVPSCAEAPNYPLHVQLLTKLPIFYLLCFDIHASDRGCRGSLSSLNVQTLGQRFSDLSDFLSYSSALIAKNTQTVGSRVRPTPALSGPPVTSHGSPVISLSPGSSLPDRLPVPRTCILRTIGANRSLQQTAYGSPFLLLFCMGGCDG